MKQNYDFIYLTKAVNATDPKTTKELTIPLQRMWANLEQMPCLLQSDRV